MQDAKCAINKSIDTKISSSTVQPAPEVKKTVFVQDEINRGNVINKERVCKKDVVTKYEVKPLYQRRPASHKCQKEKPKDLDKVNTSFHYFKPVYPMYAGNVLHKTCRHHENTIIDRQILNRAEHRNILATPRMVNYITNTPN